MTQPTIFSTPFGNLNLSETENKLLKGTIYNTVALLLLLLIASSTVSVYYLFYIFLTPLMWAVLVGTCIFPFKRSLTQCIKNWMIDLDRKNRTLVLGVTILPFSSFIIFGERLTNVVIKRYKLFLLYIIGFPTIYFIYNLGIFSYLFSSTAAVYNYASNILLMFGNKITFVVIMTLLAAFVAGLFLSDKINVQVLKLFSSGIWILTMVHLSSFVGNFGLFLFFSLMVLFIFGAFTEAMNLDLSNISLEDFGKIWEFIISPYRTNNKLVDEATLSSEIEEETLSDIDTSNSYSAVDSPLTMVPPTSSFRTKSEQLKNESNVAEIYESTNDDKTVFEGPAIENERNAGLVETVHTTFNWCYNLFSPHRSKPKFDRNISMKSSRLSQSLRSSKKRQENVVNKIFIFLLWSHIIVYSWSNFWLIFIMFIAILLVTIKKILTKFEITDGIWWLCRMFKIKLLDLIGKRIDVLFPIFIRGFVKIVFQIDEKVRKILSYCLDSLVTIFVIMVLLLATTFLAIFLAFQVQNESLHLIELTRNVLNSTMSSDLYSWLPDREDIEPLVDTITKNGYLYGRDWISKKIDQVFETSSFNKARIEESALELWEKLYQKFIIKNGTNASLPYSQQWTGKSSLGRPYSISSMQKSISNMWELMTNVDVLDLTKLSNFIRENLGLLSTVLESVWTLLKSNINIAIYIITGLLSVILGGGTFLLNLIVSFIIFLSALFFLLASSNDCYLPMEMLSNVLSIAPKSDNANKALQNVYDSVEHGISSVFAVTLKMACFYGFYTSLTHTIAGVNFVVIPSILAAMLAAVPLFGPYWAAMPAVTELVFVNQDYVGAGCLFVAHLVPMYAVDTAIYSEIEETGHPYLTGLAIAGGVYWLGLEGAVIGPLLMCSLVIILNLLKLLLYQDTDGHMNPTTADQKNLNYNPLIKRKRPNLSWSN